MEIRVYSSIETMAADKRLYCCRVSDPDSFSFDQCYMVFKSLYGKNSIICFVCV